MKLVIAPRAARDFAAQVRWLQEHSPEAGRTAAMRIVEVIDLLAAFPDIGVEIRPSIREKHIQFGRDGFIIRYRRGGGTITVQRIFHSRQDRPTTG